MRVPHAKPSRRAFTYAGRLRRGTAAALGIAPLHRQERCRRSESDVIEKARRAKADGEAKLADAERKADEILQRALGEAQNRSRELSAEAERLKAEAQETLRVAKAQSQRALEEAQNEARELASKARKDAKDKREKTEAALLQAINYALEIRQKAERRAEEIAGDALQAKGKIRDYEATAEALKNRIAKYEGTYMGSQTPRNYAEIARHPSVGVDSHAPRNCAGGSQSRTLYALRLRMRPEHTRLLRSRSSPSGGTALNLITGAVR